MKYLVILFLLFVSSSQGFSQGRLPSDSVVIDSVQAVQVLRVTRLLKKADSIRLSDSLARVALILQLEELKTTDNLQKQVLIRRIEDLENADSIRKALQLRRIDSLKAVIPGFPVAPFSDTLFFIYTKLGPLSPRERANNISRKLKELSANPDQEMPDFKIDENDHSTDIISGELIILSVTEEDALWAGTTKKDLVTIYLNAIKASLLDFYAENSLERILKRIASVFAVVIFLFLVIFYINRVFSYLKKVTYGQKGKTIHGIKFKNYEFLTPHHTIQAVFALLDFLKVVVVILSVYLSLLVLFSIFPWTKGIANLLFGYVISPLKELGVGVVNYLPNLVTVGVIYLIVRYLLRFIHFLAVEVEREELKIPGFYPDWAKPTFNIIRILLYVFMFVVIFPYLPGSGTQVFTGVLLFIGLLVSLGSVSAVSNLVAGMVITYMRPFKIGDQVKIGEIEGEVVGKSLLVTRVRTTKNVEVTVPNASILSGHTVNYSSMALDHGVVIHTTITIGYTVPWPRVHELLIEAANKTSGLLKDKAPYVLQTRLDDSYVSYELNAYTRMPKKMEITRSELHQNIQDLFSEAGIGIISPHYHGQEVK